MTEYAEIAATLKVRLAELLARCEVIEADLRHPLEADSSEQAIDLADDEALKGVDDVLRAEIAQIRQALLRIDKGNYGTCTSCGQEIGRKRLISRPIATRCIQCASTG
jgi:RNA polymerase-binding protein DksA